PDDTSHLLLAGGLTALPAINSWCEAVPAEVAVTVAIVAEPEEVAGLPVSAHPNSTWDWVNPESSAEVEPKLRAGRALAAHLRGLDLDAQGLYVWAPGSEGWSRTSAALSEVSWVWADPSSSPRSTGSPTNPPADRGKSPQAGPRRRRLPSPHGNQCRTAYARSMAKALLIVDVQNAFTEGGELGVTGGDRVAEGITGHLEAHAGDYSAIIASRDWHDADSDN